MEGEERSMRRSRRKKKRRMRVRRGINKLLTFRLRKNNVDEDSLNDDIKNYDYDFAYHKEIFVF